MSQMSSIDISCRGPPLGTGKHKTYLPQGFRGHISEGDFLGGVFLKGKKSHSNEETYRKIKRVRAADLIDDNDRLFNLSCSIHNAKRFILETFTASESSQSDVGSNSLKNIQSLFQTNPEGSLSIPSRSKVPSPPPPTSSASPYDLSIPSIVSPALFRTQSGALRSLHGYTDTSIADPSLTNGPLWGKNAKQSGAGQSGPELFFKMAVCTGSTAGGVWCDRDSFGVNMLRALLSGGTGMGGGTGTGTGTGIGGGSGVGTGAGMGVCNASDVCCTEKSNIYLTRQHVPCHKHRTGEVESRFTNVSIVDICGEDLCDPLQDGMAVLPMTGEKQILKNKSGKMLSSAAKSMHDRTQGIQAVLIVIPHDGWTDASTGNHSSMQ